MNACLMDGTLYRTRLRGGYVTRQAERIPPADRRE